MRKTIKRLVIAAVIISLVCGGIYGGLTFYKNKSTGPVRVYCASDITFPAEYYLENSTAYGSVSLDRMQTVYISGTQQVSEMLAVEGREVKKGDILFKYDTTLTSIQIEKAENELAQQKLSLKRAKEDLDKIGKLSPSSESGGGGGGGSAEEADKPSKYEKQDKPRLQEEDTPLRMSGSGTMNDPYIYLWSEKDAFTSEELLLMFRPDNWVDPEEAAAQAAESAQATETGTEAVTGMLHAFGILPYTVFASEAVETGEETPDDQTDTSAEVPDTGVEEAEEPVGEEPDAPVEEGKEGGSGSTGGSGTVEEGTEAGSTGSGGSDSTSDAETPGMIISGDDDHYVDLTGCPNEVWAILEVHEKNNREGALETRFGIHLIRAGQDVAVRLFNPDAQTADETDGSSSGDGTGNTDDADADDDDYTDDGGYDDDLDDDDDDTSSSSLITHESDIDPDASYTAKEIEDLKKQKTREVRDLDLTVRQSELALRQMKEEVGDGTVRAKINGIVKAVRDPGDAYQNNEPVVTVSGGGGYVIQIGISELDLAKLKTGDQVEVTSFSADSVTHEGEIRTISDYPSSDSEGGWWGGNPNASYYTATVYVDGDAELREYDYVSVKYGDSSSTESKMLEKMFVLKDTGGSYVYKMSAEGLLEKAYIQTGVSPDSSVIEVKSGISEEDYLAFPYGKDVKEGAPTEKSDIDKLYE